MSLPYFKDVLVLLHEDVIVSMKGMFSSLMLPEAQSGWCLSIAGSHRACLTGGPSPCLGSLREAGGVNR
jgi:hypothetical protein